MKQLMALAAMVVMTTATGCPPEDGPGETIVNECGTFSEEDLEGTDGTIPQDPATPSLVAACEELCAAMEGEAACGRELDDCVDACRIQSCDVCPGKLQPLVECRTAAVGESVCSCGADGPECEVPEACAEEEGQLGACGG
jgi:hypothetical protein